MRALTSKQFRVLKFLADQIAERGFPPSYREIMDHFGWTSTTAIHDHLRWMSRKGVVEPPRGGQYAKSRTTTITAFGYEVLDMRPPGVEGPPIVHVEQPGLCDQCGATTFAPERPCVICKVIAEVAA